MNNPRLGLVLLRAEWFGCGESRAVMDGMAECTAEMAAGLRQHLNISGPWVVSSAETLQECINHLRDAELDLVVVAHQTITGNHWLIALQEAIGNIPLLLWCYLPWRRPPDTVGDEEAFLCTGAVGAFGALGALRNRGTHFAFTYGAADDPRLVHDLRVAGKAAQVRQALRRARFGLLPENPGGKDAEIERRANSERGDFVDEAWLKGEIGPVVEHIAPADFRRAVIGVGEERLAAYLELLQVRYPVKQVGEGMLRGAAAAALGLERLAVEHRLDAVLADLDLPAAMELPEEVSRPAALSQPPGQNPLRLGLYPDLLTPGEVLFLPAGDLGAATAGMVLRQLTGSPAMLLEIWFWDEAKNQITGGHPGMQDPRMAPKGQAWVSADQYFCSQPGSGGAQMQFIAHPGRVTLFQMRKTPSRWQAVAATGMCIECRPWTGACPHAVIRLDAHIDQFLKRAAAFGVTQHWILAYGSVVAELEAFCQMCGIALEVMEN